MNEDKRTDILFDYQRPAMLSSLGLLTVLAALVAPDGIGFYFLVGALTVIALQSFHALRGWFRMKVQPLRLTTTTKSGPLPSDKPSQSHMNCEGLSLSRYLQSPITLNETAMCAVTSLEKKTLCVNLCRMKTMHHGVSRGKRHGLNSVRQQPAESPPAKPNRRNVAIRDFLWYHSCGWFGYVVSSHGLAHVCFGPHDRDIFKRQ